MMPLGLAGLLATITFAIGVCLGAIWAMLRGRRNG